MLVLCVSSPYKVIEYCAQKEYIHCNQATAVYCYSLKVILV